MYTVYIYIYILVVLSDCQTGARQIGRPPRRAAARRYRFVLFKENVQQAVYA